ncbi:MAG: hypothetical protein DYG85_13850 [Chloroflexi bacterium CFX1]|nr:hypothetical protein [Chloroflexi bacterium CFX1]MCQ3954168.1 hypothetical protein [Chloroflexota bacterium]
MPFHQSPKFTSARYFITPAWEGQPLQRAAKVFIASAQTGDGFFKGNPTPSTALGAGYLTCFASA